MIIAKSQSHPDRFAFVDYCLPYLSTDYVRVDVWEGTAPTEADKGKPARDRSQVYGFTTTYWDAAKMLSRDEDIVLPAERPVAYGPTIYV